VISVVIPAHNEARVIGRLLTALLADAAPEELEVIVVANGCNDDTEAVAASYGDQVRVVTTPVASKYEALRLGDRHATVFPRLYVDADVILGTADVRALAAAFADPGVRAVAPRRTVAKDGRPWLVRWYYDVWEQLPGVRRDLYGRGVIGVDAEGHRRLMAIPNMMGDDLAAAIAYQPAERRVVDAANVVVHAPRTTADLIRRRVRSLTATAQLSQQAPQAVNGVRTSSSDLVGVTRRRPLLAPKVAIFVGLTLVSRRRARRPIRDKDFTTWLRDESSRQE
jgi:glycosyltransferase involved in cell wall biosynthesis